MELNGLGYDQNLGASVTPTERRRRESFPVEYAPTALTRTRTVGGEPNPERPHTPEPEAEFEQRKELAPPGLLSLEAIALLAPFSILGLLARLGINAVVTYPGQAVFSLAWVQAAGCFVMGLAQSQKPFIMTFYPPLYLAITTGFCGSLTTFAGWQRDVFLAWSEEQSPAISHWHRFVKGATRLFLTQAISSASLILGESIGRHNIRVRLDIPRRRFRLIIVIISAFTYIAVFPAFFALPARYRQMVTAALLFAFPGALTRHLLGTILNPRVPPFPLGTFTSNMLGTIISSLAYLLQNLGPIACNLTAIGLLQGLADGYAGCLSTVSTYAAEIDLMSRRHAWIYAITSWFCAQILLVLILGSAHAQRIFLFTRSDALQLDLTIFMLLSAPPEILISILQFLPIHDVHNFQHLSRFANELIKNYSSSVYRNLAIYYGLASTNETLESVLSKRRVYYDLLKEGKDEDNDEEPAGVKMWKEFIKRLFLLERNWVEGKCTRQLDEFDPRRRHRIQVDEVEGTIISTYARGGLTVEDMQSERGLSQSTSPTLWLSALLGPWSHIEFDEGFLIWSGVSSEIEVWRRTSDQILNPLPADNPAERQQLEHDPINLHRPQEGVQVDEVSHRGQFQRFTLLTTPTPTSASRYVHPHLVVATRDCSFVYIYDVPNARLFKTIPLEKNSDETVRYVEHSQKHVFVCTDDQVLVFRKSDAQRVFTLTKDTQIDQAFGVNWDHSWVSRIMDRTVEGRLTSDNLDEKISDYGKNFAAAHISACGRILVVMLDAWAILVITGFDDDEESLRVTGISTSEAVFHYLAFDGYHIAAAGSNGIYTISLNRFRDPVLPLSSIHKALGEGAILRMYPQGPLGRCQTTCLQITDTALWFVGGPNHTSRIGSINFAKSTE